MKTALCTLLDDNFVIGYKAFIKSLLKWHPKIGYDFMIIDCGLSIKSKLEIYNCYRKTYFIEPLYKNYRGIPLHKTDERLQKTYYTLDAFNLPYDRVIFFDMDMVITGDISEVLNCSADFAAVKGYNAKLDILRDDINSGLFVIGPKHLDGQTYEQLLKIAQRGFSMPDQKVINIFFKDKITFLPKKYNVEKRMIETQKYKDVISDIRILHFIAGKPWMEVPVDDKKFIPYYKIWEEYYDRKN